VTALPTSATAIQLQWASVSGAASYHVERSTDHVTWKVVSPDGKQTSYTDADLLPGTTYFYRVAARVDGDDVYHSDVVSATTVGTSTVPVLLSATGSATSVDLAWSDVDGESGYQIERSPDGTNWAPLGNTGQGVTSYVDTGLAPATTYYYRVAAMTSDGGPSDPSTPLPATTTTDAGGPSTSDANATQSDTLNGP
jgi:titin